MTFVCTVFFAGSHFLNAATLTVTPSAISNLYSGFLTFQITGLTNGEPVILEKFVDANGNSSVDADELLVQSFSLTEGQISVIAGVTNVNVPGDLDGTNTSIRAQLPLPGGANQGIGNYLFRVSSPSGRFSPATATFAVTNSGFAQSISGAVVNGTNVPGAFVILLDSIGNFITGALADSAGNYQVKALPGTYQLIALKPGYVGSFSGGPVVTLGAGSSYVTNISVAAANQSIAGRVTDAGTGNGIPGIFFFVQSNAGQATIGYTDTNGNFSIPVVSGRWQIRTETDALTPVGYLALNSKVNVDTTTGSVAGLSFAVPRPTALFYGTVKTSGNVPVAGLQVSANTLDNTYKSSGFTDTNGYYTLAASGTNWNIGPSSDELALRGYSSSGTNSTLATGQAQRIDFIVQSVTASFNGRVVDENGNSVASIGISANDSGNRNANTQTDTSGNFTLGVSAGTWNLSLSSGDAIQRNLVSPNLTFTIADGQNFSNIVMVGRSPSASISGSVKNGTNAPIANIGVSLNATIGNTNYNAYVSTDANGNYSAPVINGSWDVNVNCYNLGLLNYSCPSSQFATITGPGATINFVVYGPPVGSLTFRFFTTPGDFGSGFTPAVSFPATLKQYQASFVITDANPPASVTFTGPAPSGLTNTAAETSSPVNNALSVYLSPRLNMSSNVPTSGQWTIQYKNSPNVFSNIQDPQQNSHFLVPRPTVSVANDVLKSLSWTYFNPNGSTFGGTPGFISSNMVEVFDNNSTLIYQSPFLAANATSFTFDQILNWSTVSLIRMRYLDTLTNYYFVRFTRNQPNIVSAVRTGSQFQFNMNALVTGGNYSIQYTTNLSQTNWTTLLFTNITTSPFTFIDPSPTDKARFYRIFIGP